LPQITSSTVAGPLKDPPLPYQKLKRERLLGKPNSKTAAYFSYPLRIPALGWLALYIKLIMAAPRFRKG